MFSLTKYKKVLLFFAFSGLFFTQSYADFKDDLPSNYPLTPKNEEPKIKPKPSEKASSSQSKVTNSPSTQKPSDNSGSFGSELGNHDNNAPVFFSGNYGDGSRKTGILNLKGDAVIVQDDTTLKSNVAQLFSLPGSIPSPGTSRLQRALAKGNVRILKKATSTAPEIKATGDETEFIVPERILILKGRAKVWRTNEYLNGDIIKINLISGDINIIHPEGTVDPKSVNNNFNNKSSDNSDKTEVKK